MPNGAPHGFRRDPDRTSPARARGRSPAASFILIPKQPPDPNAAVKKALKFFAWALRQRDQIWPWRLDYVPIPANLVADIEKVWAAEIKDRNGKPLFTAAN